MPLSYYNSLRKISSTPNQYWKESLQELVNDKFENASTLYTIEYFNTNTKSYEEIEVRINEGTSLTKSLTNAYILDDFKKILFQNFNEEVNLGDKFRFLGYTWIVVNTSNIASVTISCIVRRCNNLLKYYDVEHTYREFDCIVSDKIIALDYEKYTILPKNQMQLIVPYNEITKKLRPLQRFLFNGDPYRIESETDKNSFVRNGKGYLTALMVYDAIKDTDDTTNDIADGLNPENTGTYTLTINNGEDISIPLNQTLQLYPKIFKNSTEIPNQTYTYESSDNTKATVNTSGLVTPLAIGDVSIIVKWSNDASVTNTLNINVVNNVVVDEYSISISGSNTLQKDITNTYTATVYKNGVVDNTKSVVWSISDNTKASIVSSTGTTCKIKGLVNSGSFVLTAVGGWDSGVNNSLNITCKSIFG